MVYAPTLRSVCPIWAFWQQQPYLLHPLRFLQPESSKMEYMDAQGVGSVGLLSIGNGSCYVGYMPSVTSFPH